MHQNCVLNKQFQIAVCDQACQKLHEIARGMLPTALVTYLR